MFGLSPEWLLYNGQPVADSLVLAHENELARLQELTPAAAGIGVVAGDPAYDRMLRSRHLRARYRRSLGIAPDQKLVTISTTWWQRSLMGSWPSLFREVVACLPRDEYRVAGLIHPNIWHGHGPWQVHTWLADCVRAGLLLPAPVEGWQATLIASDLILGDHGATTCYGAALGSPVLLAAFPEQDVAVGSVGDVLGRTAPRLSRREPLRRQVERAFTEHSPNRFDALRDLVTSCPGEAAQRLRALCYGHLRLPEPSRQPVVPVVPAEAVASPHHQPVMADHIVCTPSGEEHPHYVIGRFPAELQVDQADERHLDDAVLMVHEDHPQQSLLSQAVVVFLAEAGPDETLKAAFGKAVRRHRGALLLALPSSDGYLVCSRDGNLVEIAGERAELGVAVLHEWRLATGDGSIPPEEVSITVGGTRSTVRLRVAEAVELLP